MAYGHAERTLATIRLLEAETAELLRNRPDLEPEQESWLRGEAGPAAPQTAGAAARTLIQSTLSA
jgi:hypothetical protein